MIIEFDARVLARLTSGRECFEPLNLYAQSRNSWRLMVVHLTGIMDDANFLCTDGKSRARS